MTYNAGIADHSYFRASIKSMLRERICIKPYVREDTTSIVPNSVDEDLNLGPENFLTLQQDRRWAEPSKSALGPHAPSPMRPRQEIDGDVVKRTIVGQPKLFHETLQSKMAKEQNRGLAAHHGSGAS